MGKLTKRDEPQSSRPSEIARLISKLKWFHIKKPFLLLRGLCGLFYSYYLECWFYILFGIGIAAIVAFETGEWVNFTISIPLLTICYWISYGNIIIWGAGCKSWFGRCFFVLFHVSTQTFVSSITVSLPPFGFLIGLGYGILMYKFAPKYGNFEIRDNWKGGAKESRYNSVQNLHVNHVRQLQQQFDVVNQTMFLGIPLTDVEATTSFIVFGEVRSGKSLILSMLMKSLEE